MDGTEAYKRIRAGATLVQIYSAILLHGPYVGTEMLKTIKACMEKDGFKNIEEAIGKDVAIESEQKPQLQQSATSAATAKAPAAASTEPKAADTKQQ